MCVCIYTHIYTFLFYPSFLLLLLLLLRFQFRREGESEPTVLVPLIPSTFLSPPPFSGQQQQGSERLKTRAFADTRYVFNQLEKVEDVIFTFVSKGIFFIECFPSFVSINISLLTGSKNSPNSNKLKISLRFPPTSNLANDRSSGEEFGGKVDTSARTKERRRRGESYGGLNYSSQIKRSEPANIIYRPVGCLFRVVIKARTRKPIIMKLTNYPLVQRLDLSLPLPPPPYTSSRESHRFSHPKPVQPVHPTSSSVLAP